MWLNVFLKWIGIRILSIGHSMIPEDLAIWEKCLVILIPPIEKVESTPPRQGGNAWYTKPGEDPASELRVSCPPFHQYESGSTKPKT